MKEGTVAHGSTEFAVTSVFGSANIHGSLLIAWMFEYRDDPIITVYD